MSRLFDGTDPAKRTQAVAAAASAARRGRLVLLPTESVYALLTDAFSARGVSALRTHKGRPAQAPLPVAVASVAMLRGVAERLPSAGQDLIEAFWPGPLSLLCWQQPSLAWSIGGGRAMTVRMPLHPLTLDVITAVGPCVLMAAEESPGPDVNGVDVVLDAGPLPQPPVVSSVVDVRGDVPVLVRQGALTLERLREVAPVAPPEPSEPAS
jgi:L-threonylcarbamoyladenylate synthase